MKLGAVLLGLAVAFGMASGCSSKVSNTSGGPGGGTCTHGIVGTWVGTTKNDRSVLSSDLTFSYVGSDGCAASGTYSCPGAGVSSGTIAASIDSSSGGECPPAGDYICSFNLNGNTMTFECDGGTALPYTRQ